ncbi:hypothetical protein J6590_106842 [Homalodisca vitripennis]|nr:hypothetical protein J6590_106842 [Homalodisca vitripennis]
MYEYINKTTPHLEIATLVVYDMTKQYYSENNLDEIGLLRIFINKNQTWKPQIDQTNKKTAYFELFESHMRYGIAVLEAAGSTYFDIVLVQKKKAIYKDCCRTAERCNTMVVALSIFEISPVTETCTIKIQEMPPALVCSLIIEYLCDEAILEKETINFNNLPDLLIGCCKTLERRHSMARVQRPFHSVKRFLNF